MEKFVAEGKKILPEIKGILYGISLLHENEIIF